MDMARDGVVFYYRNSNVFLGIFSHFSSNFTRNIYRDCTPYSRDRVNCQQSTPSTGRLPPDPFSQSQPPTQEEDTRASVSDLHNALRQDDTRLQHDTARIAVGVSFQSHPHGG